MHAFWKAYHRTSNKHYSANIASIEMGIDDMESSCSIVSDSNISSPKLHRTTIARREKGQIQPRDQYKGKCQLLTPAQEEVLVKYIDELTRRGLPPNHHNVRVFASNICGKLPGKKWATKFVERHKDSITSQYLVGFDITRKRADNYWLINKYFELVEDKMNKYKYPPHNIYNMDEKGFMIGIIQKTKRIFTRSWQEQGKLKGAAQDGSRTWITFVAAICADGTSLPPSLIYPSASGDIQDVWLEDYKPEDGAYITSSPTGWTNNELAMQWLINLFDRHTKQKARLGRDPRLLILDGHGSHINMEFLEWCEIHNIHVCAFPPHTTHRLQPLDVSLFAPLSAYYSQNLDNWMLATQGLCRMNKRHFYKLFREAFLKAFSKKNIKSGWYKTALEPFNKARVLDTLSTKEREPVVEPVARPVSSSSASSSVISLSDWKKINRVVRDAIGDVLGYEGIKVLKLTQQLQAENALLKAQNLGLQEAVRIVKKQKKPKKGLFKDLRGDDGNAAIFFSPAKITQARELQTQKILEAEAEEALKAQKKLEQQQKKEEQAQLKKDKATACAERREKAAQAKA